MSFSLVKFATGYASLSCRKRLSPEQLKIEQPVVHDLLNNPPTQPWHTIVSLSYSLGLRVIAECDEGKGPRDFLERIGCDAYQGYFFGHLLPVGELLAALGQHEPHALTAHA